ncbi:MAG: hypothetical protein IPI79_06845 [Moraxellaceae bacterium]|nr:hypothetical protein [Moraxellaceae bacterium]
MNLEQAKSCFLNGYLVNVEVFKNPGNMAQWFVLVQNSLGKSCMLEDGNGHTVVNSSVDQLLLLIHEIGFRQVMVHL